MLPACSAQLHHRALQAQRPAWQTNRRPQLHHRLVEISRTARIQQLAGRYTNLRGNSASLSPASHPRQHARDVAIYARGRLAKANAGNRRARVFPDAGQRPQLCHRRRQLPIELLRHKASRLMQHARAAVVAEAAPARQHLIFTRLSQRRQRWETLHKPRIVIDHCRHARLLQHDF